MVRFGISPKNTLGISIPILRDLAKKIKKEKKLLERHLLARDLWKTKIHEARLLACFIDDPKQVLEKQIDNWTDDFDSWDIVDQCCSNLFDKTPFVYQKILEYTKNKKDFVRRTGFVLIACLSVHDKKMENEELEKFFPLIKKYATDERNFVRKAVNWALRQIGKRNLALNKKAIKVAEEIKKINNKTAKWIASDALKELKSEAVQKRLKDKSPD